MMSKTIGLLALFLTIASCEEVRLENLEPNEAEQIINSKDQSLKYAPKIESNVPAVRFLGRSQQHVLEDIYLANQYHGQDGLGAYAYGYSVPDIAKAEKKNRGGSLSGSYSYVNDQGQEIKVQYWDDGTGFHQIDNVPQILPQQIDDTPEVKAAKEEHYRIWQEEAVRNSQPPQVPSQNPYQNAYGQQTGYSGGFSQPSYYNPSVQENKVSPYYSGAQNPPQPGYPPVPPSFGQPQVQPPVYRPPGPNPSFPPSVTPLPNLPSNSIVPGYSPTPAPYQIHQGYVGSSSVAPPAFVHSSPTPAPPFHPGLVSSTIAPHVGPVFPSSTPTPFHGPSAHVESQYGQYQGPSQIKQGYSHSGPNPPQDYSGQYSDVQKNYVKNPLDAQNEKEWEGDEEEKGPPKGFFYNFDYPVGIIVQKQGDLNTAYSQNKELFEKQLRGEAPAPGTGSNFYHASA